MKNQNLIFISIFFFCFFIPLINADVISLNSGGSETIVISPNEYIDGFFSDIPTTPTPTSNDGGGGGGGTVSAGAVVAG